MYNADKIEAFYIEYTTCYSLFIKSAFEWKPG